MRKLTKNRVVVFAAIVAAALVAALWGGSATKSAPSPPSVPIVGISADDLSEAGISLQQPSAAAPLATKNAAASTAQSFAGGAAVLDEQFAHCVAPNASIDQDCWAVSLDPSGFQANGPAINKQATYLIVLVDPSSNSVLIGADGTP